MNGNNRRNSVSVATCDPTMAAGLPTLAATIRCRAVRAAGLVGLALMTTTPALAQSTFDAHGFNLVGFDDDVRDPLTVHRPGRFHQNDWFAGGLLEYAKAPLRIYEDSGDGYVEQTMLDNIFALNTSVGYAVHDRVRLEMGTPLYFSSTGPDDQGQGVGLGDIQMSAMLAMVRPEGDADSGGLGLGLVPFITIPVGATDAFLGQAGVAGGAHVAATYEASDITLTGSLGARFNPAIELENLAGSDVLLTGLGFGYLFNPNTSVTLEADIESPFSTSPNSWTAAPSELTLSGHQRQDNGGHYSAGLAMAITPGAGAAVYRLLIGGGFGATGTDAPVDPDGDGLIGDLDACPDVAETFNRFEDEDGCPDGLGSVEVSVLKQGVAAPNSLVDIEGGPEFSWSGNGAARTFADITPGETWTATATEGACWNGEAVATVSQGVTQLVIDLQPTLGGTVKVEAVDAAGEPVPDATVSWTPNDSGCLPDEAMVLSDGMGQQSVGTGKHRISVMAPGYATHGEVVTVTEGGEQIVRAVMKASKIKVTREQIVILDKVHFATGSAVIKEDSFGLLTEVAQVLIDNPQLGRVEVAGHTDSQGAEKSNLNLSQRRAEAVVVFLTGVGAEQSKLIAKGYGESEPVADNNTSSGRSENRRVVFTLIDQTKGGE